MSLGTCSFSWHYSTTWHRRKIPPSQRTISWWEQVAKKAPLRLKPEECLCWVRCLFLTPLSQYYSSWNVLGNQAPAILFTLFYSSLISLFMHRNISHKGMRPAPEASDRYVSHLNAFINKDSVFRLQSYWITRNLVYGLYLHKQQEKAVNLDVRYFSNRRPKSLP